jgi:hypothetical protein
VHPATFNTAAATYRTALADLTGQAHHLPGHTVQVMPDPGQDRPVRGVVRAVTPDPGRPGGLAVTVDLTGGAGPDAVGTVTVSPTEVLVVDPREDTCAHAWTYTEPGYTRTFATRIRQEDGHTVLTGTSDGLSDYSEVGDGSAYLQCELCGQIRPVPTDWTVDLT